MAKPTPTFKSLLIEDAPTVATGAVRKFDLDALRAELNTAIANLTAQTGTGGTGTSGVQPYTQRKIIPAGPFLTDNNKQPLGFVLQNPNSNILNLDFSSTDPSASVKTRAELNKQVWFRSIFGDMNSPGTAPNNGIPSNFASVYADYPATLADGVTPDPRDLHVIKSDGLHLGARKRMATSSGSANWECGYIRLPGEFLPGDTIEMRARLPSSKRVPGSLWSWPTFWSFTGWQNPVTGTRYFGQPGKYLEFDMPDTFQIGGDRQGTQINYGFVPTTSLATYGNAAITYRTENPRYFRRGGNSNSMQVMPIPEEDPTEIFHTYSIVWKADNTQVTYLTDGKVMFVLDIVDPNINNQVSGQFDSGPFDPARQGQTLGHHVILSHQFGVNFNTDDRAALDTATNAGNVVADDYVIDYVRHWRSTPATLTPTIYTPDTNLTVDGDTYAWVNQGDAVLLGGGTQPLSIISPPSGNNDQVRMLVRPTNAATGTFTAKIALLMRGVDFFSGGLVLRNSSTGKLIYIRGLYPSYKGIWMNITVHTSPTSAGTSQVTSSQQLFSRIAEYGYFRAVLTATEIQFLGSYNGDANTYTLLGTVSKATAGDPDQVGFYCNPKDGAGAGTKAHVRCAFIRYAASTDPQAAIPTS